MDTSQTTSSPPSVEPIVQLSRVSKSFPGVGRQGKVHALSDVDLTIVGDVDKFVVLLGPSGCGKSTLLSLISGLQTANHGTVRVCGKDVTGPSNDSVTVQQAYTCFPWLTALQNVEFGLIGTNKPPEERRQIAMEYLDKVGLRDRLHAYPRQLSGGMQQRVAIARALALKRPLLLMDEPFGALDAQIRVDMQQMLLSLWAEEKNTIIFVTHDISEALLLADRVVVMSANPARIIHDTCVPFSRPRLDQAQTPAFCAASQDLLRRLRTAPASLPAVASGPPWKTPTPVMAAIPSPTASASPSSSQLGGPAREAVAVAGSSVAAPIPTPAPQSMQAAELAQAFAAGGLANPPNADSTLPKKKKDKQKSVDQQNPGSVSAVSLNAKQAAPGPAPGPVPPQPQIAQAGPMGGNQQPVPSAGKPTAATPSRGLRARVVHRIRELLVDSDESKSNAPKA